MEDSKGGEPGPGIVPAGDRFARHRPRTVLPALPPREVGRFALWSGCIRNHTALPIAIGLTAASGGLIAALAESGIGAIALILVIPAAALLVLVAWIAGLRAIGRVGRLLESGMPVRARLTRVHVNVFVHSAGRSRVTIEYDWTFAGEPRHSKAHGFLSRHDRGLIQGGEIVLVCDPSAPADHLAPIFYGFDLEAFS